MTAICGLGGLCVRPTRQRLHSFSAFLDSAAIMNARFVNGHWLDPERFGEYGERRPLAGCVWRPAKHFVQPYWPMTKCRE
jgi:hypothetical protein